MSTEHKVEWNLPEDKLAELQALHTQVKALYELCQTASYTKLDIQQKKEKKDRLVHLEEVFVRNNLQNNDAMTDEGRKALRIPVYDSKPTPRPAPEGIPQIEITTPLPRTVHIKFRDEHAARWGKPKYVHGLECLRLIADTPPAKVKDLLHSEFATRSPLELAFDEDERGKKVYFAARWESGRRQGSTNMTDAGTGMIGHQGAGVPRSMTAGDYGKSRFNPSLRAVRYFSWSTPRNSV